ncbi:MAG TPA: hypothetical protein VKB42_17530 [Dongiaceae bacterium]|jgi:hypothetical protein|nr:hypothetical protein [Dongiaceae bacterium]
MSKLNRIAMALLLAQPLVVGAGAAFAFSLVDRDSTPGLPDSDAALNNLSDNWVAEGSTQAVPLIVVLPVDPSKLR